MGNKKSKVISDATQRIFDSKNYHEKIQGLIEDTLTTALDEKVLRAEVEKKVKESWSDLTCKMLGMRESFSRWEVSDNRGDSYFKRAINKKAEESTEAILEKVFAVLPNLDLTSKHIDGLSKYYDKRVKLHIEDALDRKAKEDVEAFVENSLAKAIDFDLAPEAEAIRALRQTIRKTTDEETKKLLETSLKALEKAALDRLE